MTRLDELRERKQQLLAFSRDSEYLRQRLELNEVMKYRRMQLVEAPLTSIEDILSLVQQRGEIAGLQYAANKVGFDIEQVDADIDIALQEEEDLEREVNDNV